MDIKSSIEAILFAAGDSVPVARLSLILEVDENNAQLKLSIKNINYKSTNNSKVKESRLGFLPLKNHLNKWIADKISEIEKNNSNN